MGEFLMVRIRNMDKRYKTALLSAMVIGLAVHIYKFANNLPNQDTLSNFYSSQNILASGRWFLSVSCALTSYFDLPWINGLFSLFWIALTAAVFVNIFEMRNTTLIVLTGGLLATFPAVTEIFFYEFTADGYMLAMLLAAVAVYLTQINRKGIAKTVAAMVCIMLCCGIYQCYVSFALVLAICYFMYLLLENRYSTREYLLWIVRQSVVYVAGLALYFVAWKLCMHYQSVVATDYQGINSLGFGGIGGLIVAIKTAIVQFLNFFLNEWLSGNNVFSVLLVLNIAFLAVFGVSFVRACIKEKIWKRKLHVFLLLLCLSAIPLTTYMWLFASSNVTYIGMRMKQSFCVLYVFAAVLAEKWLKPKWSNVVAFLLAVIVFNNGITANILYFYMNQAWDRSYATAIEMTTRIHEMDDGTIKSIVLVGREVDSLSGNNYMNMSKLGNYYGKSVASLLMDESRTAQFLGNVLDLKLQYYSEHPDEKPNYQCSDTASDGANISSFSLLEKDARNEILGDPVVQAMPNWPAKESMRILGDTLIIKYSEENIQNES